MSISPVSATAIKPAQEAAASAVATPPAAKPNIGPAVQVSLSNTGGDKDHDGDSK